MSEHVQAFDYHRDRQGILHFGLYDCETDVIKTEAVSKETSIVGGAIRFLQKAWASGPPQALALDAAPLGKAKSFKGFLEGEGVELRCLHPADMQIRAKLERNFFPRSRVV